MAVHPSTSSGFRDDINGLRAWAVVAVVLYHFGISGFDGGFVGVDIFFVISGFLMTGIVVSGLEKNKFRLFGFYMARARRILPALVVLCAVLMAVGWWLLLPLDYKEVATHVIASVGFFSNIKFWSEAGYFDAGSHEKWLLHTWSLAVEWQFYLLLPLLLLLVWKLRPGRRSMVVAVAASLLASLVTSVVLTPKSPTAAFFLLHTRAWEMLSGGLAYLFAGHCAAWTVRQRRWAEGLGVVLLVGAIAGFDATSPWPGWRALVPVLGTVVILLAAQPASRWTGTAAAQWLGTRSYSLYLWHWPLAVALTYLNLRADPVAIAASLGLTLLLGDLSYRWVETPARVQLGRLGTGWGVAALMGAAGLVAAQGLGVRMQEGVLGRFAPEIEVVRQEALNRNPRTKPCLISNGIASPSCMYGGPRLRAIVVGDSHADAVVSAVAAAVPQPQDGVMEWAFSGCPTLQGVKSIANANWQCGDFVEWSLQKLKQIAPGVPVVLVNRHGGHTAGPNEIPNQRNQPSIYFSKPYSEFGSAYLKEYAQHLVQTACSLAQGRQVYLVRPIPELGIDVPQTARGMVWGQFSDTSISLESYHQRNAFVWAAQDAAREQCGVKILDPLPYLCPQGQCLGIKNGRPVYFDDDHLSEYGNKLLVPMFAEVFQNQSEGMALINAKKALK